MEQLKASLKQLIKDVFGADIEPQLSRPDEQFGDYATNAALQLAKQLSKNPREVAEQLADKLQDALADQVERVSIAGPGFINFTLTDEQMRRVINDVIDKKEKYGQSAQFDNKNIVIETNNPNPFKDMHIGHAYNSIVADSIANLLEAGNGRVHRVSYHGDVGLHVGKSMWAILDSIDHNPAKLDGIAEAERPQFMSKAYARGADAYENDPSAKAVIDELAQQSFSLKDDTYKTVYETCKAWSFAYFDQIFNHLGSQPIERRYLEREADAAGREAVERHIGDVFEKSDGAIIFPGENYGLHTRVFISTQGNTLYEARDLGLIQLKAADFKPDASYIVTAAEQKEYFRVVLKAAELALPDLAGITRNIPTGTVKLSSGKMSSRRGNFINIGWLIGEVAKALIERGGQAAASEDAIIGALRYTMLKVRIGSDVTFDIGEAISLEGNSGPYLQYAHARACSIINKSANKPLSLHDTHLTDAERSLVRKMSEYPEVVEKAVAELTPHNVCTYLYELTQKFNTFYEHNRVIGDEREVSRLTLLSAYIAVLRNGLGLLGIPAPERM